MPSETSSGAAWYHFDGNDLTLRLRIQPKASKNEFAGLQGDCLKVRITAPPVDGKANAQLRAFLAKSFGIPRSKVIIEHGETSRTKRVRIQSPKVFPLPEITQN